MFYGIKAGIIQANLEKYFDNIIVYYLVREVIK